MYKKLIINIVIVLAVVAILDFAIGRTMRYFYFKETSGLHYRTTYSMETTVAQTLIFGSSRANHHYIPQVFEDSLQTSCYNSGRDGNGIFYQLALLKTILKRYTPKVIILEYSGEFNKDLNDFDRISSLLPYYRGHKEIRNIIEMKSPLEKVKLLSEIYPFNSQGLTIAVGNLEANKKRVYDNQGYVALTNEWTDELDSAQVNNNYTLDTNKVNAFRNFISLAKGSGIHVFVIISPVFQIVKSDKGIEKCTEICKEEQVPLFNYEQEPFFLKDRTLFQDIIHLNNKGATAFSKMIASRIKHSIN